MADLHAVLPAYLYWYPDVDGNAFLSAILGWTKIVIVRMTDLLTCQSILC
jgi:hypothetical protein